MADKSRMFVPGYNPGPVAAGFASDANIMALAAKRLKMAGIPTGDKVAPRFPWMRYVRELVESGEQFAVKRQQWDDTFANNTPRPILVTEVRVYLGNKEKDREAPARGLGGTVYGVALNSPPVSVPLLQKSLWVKMSIPDRKDIIQKWVPYPLINTVCDFNIPIEVDRMAFPLPAPYFLNRSNPFRVDVPKNEALLGTDTAGEETAFFLTLHGWGAEDGQPIDLVKRVPTIASADYNPAQYQTIVFDEDRDMPMRDAWITHIGIGAGVIDNRVIDSKLGWILQNLQIRPHAPEGPSWHSGEFFPMALLAEQISCIWNTATPQYIQAGARHIPVVPYVLFPGEQLVVELWNRTDVYAKQVVPTPPGAEAVDFSVDVGVLGLQESLS